MDLNSIHGTTGTSGTGKSRDASAGAVSGPAAYTPRALEHAGPDIAPSDVIERSEALRVKLAELKESFEQEKELSAAKIRELREMLSEDKAKRRDALLDSAEAVLNHELRLPTALSASDDA